MGRGSKCLAAFLSQGAAEGASAGHRKATSRRTPSLNDTGPTDRTLALGRKGLGRASEPRHILHIINNKRTSFHAPSASPKALKRSLNPAANSRPLETCTMNKGDFDYRVTHVDGSGGGVSLGKRRKAGVQHNAGRFFLQSMMYWYLDSCLNVFGELGGAIAWGLRQAWRRFQRPSSAAEESFFMTLNISLGFLMGMHAPGHCWG